MHPRTTRAVAIGAAPADVWPWIVQLGVGRAGAYSYDWLDRLFGLDVRSLLAASRASLSDRSSPAGSCHRSSR